MLIRINGQEAEMKPLAKHNTTWKYHRSHCHPTFSWDGRKILYTADRDDANCDLYLVDAEFYKRKKGAVKNDDLIFHSSFSFYSDRSYR